MRRCLGQRFGSCADAHHKGQGSIDTVLPPGSLLLVCSHSIPKCNDSKVSECPEPKSGVKAPQKGLRTGHNLVFGFWAVVQTLILHILWMLHVPASSKAPLKELKVKLNFKVKC